MTTISAMPPGTIVTFRHLVLRRRPHATSGLPWKSFDGARYDHDEVATMVTDGAEVSFCEKCAVRSCADHDRFWCSR